MPGHPNNIRQTSTTPPHLAAPISTTGPTAPTKPAFAKPLNLYQRQQPYPPNMYAAVSNNNNNNNLSPFYYYTPTTPTPSSNLVYSSSSSPRDLPISPATIYAAPTPPVPTAMMDHGLYIDPVYAQQQHQHNEYITSIKSVSMPMMSSPVAPTAGGMDFSWITTADGSVPIAATAGTESNPDFVGYTCAAPQSLPPQPQYPYEPDTPSNWVPTSTSAFDNSIAVAADLNDDFSSAGELTDDAYDHDHQVYDWYALDGAMPLSQLSSDCCATPMSTASTTPLPQYQSSSAMTSLVPYSSAPPAPPASLVVDDDTDVPMEKKYQCQICGKYFRRDLPRHVRTHQEEGRFTCPFSRDQCPHKRGQFNRPYDFKKHLLHGHFTFDDQKRVRSFRNLRSKLSFSGVCGCGKRFTASDWLEHHVLGGQDRCPLLIGVAADRLARSRQRHSSLDHC